IAYLEFQKIRTPREANWAFAVMHQFLKSSIYSNPALIKAKQAMESGLVKLTIKDHARFEYLRNMTGFFFKFLPYMRWEVMVAPDKCPYIVSDHPVTMFNPSAQPLAQPGYVSEEAGLIRTDPGIGLAGTRILFPLDTKHLLMISHLVYPTRITDPLARLSYDEMQEEMLIPFSYVDATCQFVTDINYVIFQCAHTLVAGPSKEPIQKALSGKGIEFREIYARC
ncbi:MAG: DUF4238 domain-containing protein, partial [Thermodesulfobacteriota bacterium]|nr:DUF4238 domain-containing protein [Thermodesulfobacteriota bacterium]